MAQQGTVEAVRTAIARHGVGEDDLFADLVALDAVAGIDVVDGQATVRVTLPVVEAGLRGRLESALRTAIVDLEAVDSVSVDWSPDVADQSDRVDLLPNVKNVIAVSSGKGGVGKSTVAANLAAALADADLAVGLLDADVYGPNAPTLLGAPEGSPSTTQDARIVPPEANGVKVMSMDFIVGEDDPIIWRGPMVDDVLHQLTGDVDWGELDYLIVDLPPGTGDAQLTLVQHLPVTGAVIVTTPQAVAGGAAELAEEVGIPMLGRLPLDPSIGTVGAAEDGSAGIELPILGRLTMPRTREERSGRLPPSALRDGEPVRSAMRAMATRVAARCQHAVIRETAE